MDYLTVVDVEASGLSPLSYPIEVGIYGHQIQYQKLILPVKSWDHWSAKAEALHGLSRDHLFRDGEHVTEVACELNALLRGTCIYSDHADWDGFWIQRLFEAAATRQLFSVVDIGGLFTAGEMADYTIALEELNHGARRRAHRALDDARAIHEAMACVLNRPVEAYREN
ncbi:hypothetical protein [Haliea sp.]